MFSHADIALPRSKQRFLVTKHLCSLASLCYTTQGNPGGVAQRLEQRAHNLLVAGSIPATPTRNNAI